MSGAEPPVGDTSGSSAPVPSQQQQQQEITAAQLSDAIREIIRQQQQQQDITAAARSRSDELRGWLMVVATLAASITYSSALNPPGGVWQADDAANGYTAGRPVLHDKFPAQYHAFYYFNVTSFAMSLCIIVLTSTPSLYNRIQMPFFSNLVTLDILALAGAFIAGSWTGLYQLVFCFVLLLIVLLWFVCRSNFWRRVCTYIGSYRPERVDHI